MVAEWGTETIRVGEKLLYSQTSPAEREILQLVRSPAAPKSFSATL